MIACCDLEQCQWSTLFQAEAVAALMQDDRESNRSEADTAETVALSSSSSASSSRESTTHGSRASSLATA